MKKLLTTILIFCTVSAFAQKNTSEDKEEAEVTHKWRVSFPYFIVTDPIGDSWSDRENTQMIELHVKRNLDNKNIVGVKLATWRLFQPMGITWWDGLLDKLETKSEFYSGHVRETGIGITYQRMLWKGLFATAEVLPQFQTYIDLEGNKLGNGFKVYNSYHLGYHIDIGKKKRFFIEPQVHSQHWMFGNNAPEGFKQLDDKWRDYFLFEPNIYIGLNF
ncbi:hypothetical protein [Jiulongibacter sediminis]|uniref:Uncharacterized protein n=1 Tax=Jiulongibacter sediminis TaxID=1605367 RepID=A0A0P7BB68_9BACT|nr:hypothetical protein [Jiulongibacter sediminis]KPM47717.1 hypothetical protein AFM12_14315 [Jiulongibacter sediminis]TBX23508.1 hypothetical protein TK44_14325 [Jiulongibacter sediminis]